MPGAHLKDDLAALQATLATERVARQEAEARASSAEAMVVYLKLLIAKMKRDRFGQSSECGRQLLDQLELQIEELQASATENEAAAAKADPNSTTVRGFTRKQPVRAPRRRVCRVSGWSSRHRAPAPVAAASSSKWARTSPRRWRWCRGNGR